MSGGRPAGQKHYGWGTLIWSSVGVMRRIFLMTRTTREIGSGGSTSRGLANSGAAANSANETTSTTVRERFRISETSLATASGMSGERWPAAHCEARSLRVRHGHGVLVGTDAQDFLDDTNDARDRVTWLEVARTGEKRRGRGKGEEDGENERQGTVPHGKALLMPGPVHPSFGLR